MKPARFKYALLKPVLLAALAAFTLSGCEQLTVESIPTGEAVACDKDFVGWWRVETESANDNDGALHLHVSDDCAHWLTVETDTGGEGKREDLSAQMRFDFRHVGDNEYLAVSNAADNANDKHEIGDGFVLLRYVVHDDHIDLFEGDPRREAHRIAEGLVRGKVEADSHAQCGTDGKCNVNTIISGDGDAIADWLKRFDPIDRAFVELRRVDAETTTELDALLKMPGSAGKPKPHE